MPTDKRPTHEEVLQKLHEGIDMPRKILEDVFESYQSLGKWLDRDGSEIKAYDPFVSPQGSILLGTANRPIGDDEEYDVDLICRLLAKKLEITQKALKQVVGREVIAYARAQAMKHEPEDKRRCWTLKYARDRRFHMDVLPCIPDAERYRRSLMDSGFGNLADNAAITEDAVAITDKTDPNYEKLTDDWPSSNPLGFAAWFFDRMAKRLLVEKRELMKCIAIYDKVEDVPNHKVKTTLQKAVQLLKRHRDTMFADDPEHKPISIIISTLSAHAYGNEETLVDALTVILQTMDHVIENRGGVTWISNPVNPNENFADKWEEEPIKGESFRTWLTAARRDFGAYLNSARPEDVPPILKERLGETMVEKVVDAIRPSVVAAPAIITAPRARADAMATQVRESEIGTKPWCGVDR
jgi:Cyclic GMP-AMP synthase DncV-like, nucleotidyltransferase domain